MAKQHFYARVPAQYSLYNHSDSFDTVAVSDGITREFVEQEMSFFLENSLTGNDAENIRLNRMPPVYAQYQTKRGALVQACISYQKKDFTGERQAYFVHSLILSEEEQNALFRGTGETILNRENFMEDVGPLLQKKGKAESFHHYPEVTLKVSPAESPEWLTSEYESIFIRQFIYALLSCVCGKTRALYFSFGENEKETSEKALRLMNALLPVFPDFIRRKMSFCTRVSEPGKLTPIKIKAIPASSIRSLPSQSIYFRFAKQSVDGMKESDMASEHRMVDFLYSLLSQPDQLREFLAFVHHFSDVLPEKLLCTFKAMQEIVTLFLSCTQYYPEKKVLPNDDAMLDFFTSYEKYRTAIPDEYRIQGIRSIRRYEEDHHEIPQKLFAIISRIYPDEIPGTQYTIMRVCLALIHTDLMRDKLFRFLVANYGSSQPETQDEIVEHLCRVFYGEFLQKQIITFFLKIFPDCSENSHERILSTMIRSIRVKSCQKIALDFLQVNYPLMTEENKKQLYADLLDNIRYGDSSAQEILLLIDSFYENETEEYRTLVSERITAQLEKERTASRKPLLALIGSNRFLCCETAEKNLLINWTGIKAFEQFVSAGEALPIPERFAPYLSALPDLSDEEALSHFLSVIASVSLKNAKTESFLQEMELYRTAKKKETETKSEAKQNFTLFLQQIVIPMLRETLQDSLRQPEFAENILRICEFCETIPELKNEEAYLPLASSKDLLIAVREGNVKAIASLLPKKEEEKPLRLFMARALRADLKSNSTTEETVLLLSTAILSYLDRGTIGWQKGYDEAVAQMEKAREAQTANDFPAEAEQPEEPEDRPEETNETEEPPADDKKKKKKEKKEKEKKEPKKPPVSLPKKAEPAEIPTDLLRLMLEFGTACADDEILFPIYRESKDDIASVFSVCAGQDKQKVLTLLSDCREQNASSPTMQKLIEEVISTVKKRTGFFSKILRLK